MRFRLFPPLLLAILVIGIGCFSKESFAPPATTEPVGEFLGVVSNVDVVNQRVTLGLPDQSTEIVLPPTGIDLRHVQIGKLMRVSGERERTTRVITASTFSFVETPNLHVASPTRGATVVSPLVVFGFGRTFEQTFRWRIRNAEGKEVAVGYETTGAVDAGQFDPFRFDVFLPVLTDPSFTLEVFWGSPDDGKELDVVKIPLRLLDTETVTYKIFLGNTAMGSGFDCRQVFPVERTMAKTSAIGRLALLDLLKGPTAAEKRQGYFTSLPSGVTLWSLVIGNEEARVDFSAELNRIGGSCRVSAIRAQIEDTLRQFPTVGNVTISVDGNVEEALQP